MVPSGTAKSGILSGEFWLILLDCLQTHRKTSQITQFPHCQAFKTRGTFPCWLVNDDFLSDLNEANISWTNWTYKARGIKFESGGGNWGYYNTYTGTDPDLMHDSYDEIKAIWQNTRTESAFSANQPLINTVSARADGSTNYPYVALDRTNWTILATHTSSDPYNPVGYMIDGDSSTRWSTGAGQAFGQSITINFGQSENFDKIEMDHDGSDYPGGYKVEISSDGINYTQVTLKATPHKHQKSHYTIGAQ